MRGRAWEDLKRLRGLLEQHIHRCLLSSLLLGAGLGLCSAEAQMSEKQVHAFVEALRLAAPQGSTDSGLYSEWQIKPANIPRWSKRCTGKELTPTEFAANPEVARAILLCVMGGVLYEQYKATEGDIDLTVQRAASWWLTGDPKRYNDAAITSYTQKVLDFFHKQVPPS